MAQNTTNGFPEGGALQSQISGRHLRGTIWRIVFLSTLILAIIVLIILLVTIFVDGFGLVAVQNVVEPESLVLDYVETDMLTAPDTIASEDDNELVAGIAGDPDGTGFFGYAFYANNSDKLRLVSIENTIPDDTTTSDGSYPLTRPLELISSASVIAAKPQVGQFILYYLQHVNEEIENIGYFAIPDAEISEIELAVMEALGLDTSGSVPMIDPATVSGNINIAGSSTVFPLTERIAERFKADGYGGEINIESIGSSAGIRAFCVDGSIDIANASRKILPEERAACRSNDRDPIESQVGTDAIAVVVNPANTFADNLSLEELGILFTTAAVWSDVDGSWPDNPVHRYIPGADSGTLDFFASTAFDLRLQDLPKDALVAILGAGITENVGRRLEREQRFYNNAVVFNSAEEWVAVCSSDEPPAGCTSEERSQNNVYLLVQERIVQPKILQAWPLTESIFNRQTIIDEVGATYPDARVEFRSWLNRHFLNSPTSSQPELAGFRTAILGSIFVIIICILFALPVGVGAAIYLEEYASQDKWYNRIIQTNIYNLAGVPSIIYGMLGLAIFVRALEPITSGALFGFSDAATANGRTILSAGLTLGLLILPIIIINGQEAIRAVPNSLRQASYGLGATKWDTVRSHVLPGAIPGILTGSILAFSRAIGETAPLIVVGASTFVTVDPTGPFSKFTVMPILIYNWTSRPQKEYQYLAAAGIIILLVLLIIMNSLAIYLRNRTQGKRA
ncbi:MAG: phosphate ABC transporter permease PstA [Anaerolineae bacterium]|nr:phosphate ABC transporter permease PstA [Anaerolineae bacterium]